MAVSRRIQLATMGASGFGVNQFHTAQAGVDAGLHGAEVEKSTPCTESSSRRSSPSCSDYALAGDERTWGSHVRPALKVTGVCGGVCVAARRLCNSASRPICW